MSNHPNDGGPAFSTQNGCRYDPGMTLRDYLAAAALQGYMANPEFCMGHDSPRNVAANCYDYADAMLADRDGKGGA
jgi:hypothetical protein